MFKKIIKGLKDVWCGSLEFDTTPKAGSLNPVTSDGVKEAISEAVADIPSIEAAIPEGAGEEDQLVKSSELNTVDGRLESVESKIPYSASSTDKLVTKSELENATASMESGYTPKGPASVSTLNGLTGQENGDQYIVTDSGTLTDGSLAVTAGESVAWDSVNEVWYKVNQYALKSEGLNNVPNLNNAYSGYLPLVSGNEKGKFDLGVIFDNFAGTFEENVTVTKSGHQYLYRGGLYIAKVTGYQGVWDYSKFRKYSWKDFFEVYMYRNRVVEYSGYGTDTDKLIAEKLSREIIDAKITIKDNTNFDEFWNGGYETPNGTPISDHLAGVSISRSNKLLFWMMKDINGDYLDSSYGNCLLFVVDKSEGTTLFNSVKYYSIDFEWDGVQLNAELVVDWSLHTNYDENISSNYLDNGIVSVEHAGVISAIHAVGGISAMTYIERAQKSSPASPIILTKTSATDAAKSTLVQRAIIDARITVAEASYDTFWNTGVTVNGVNYSEKNFTIAYCGDTTSQAVVVIYWSDSLGQYIPGSQGNKVASFNLANVGETIDGTVKYVSASETVDGVECKIELVVNVQYIFQITGVFNGNLLNKNLIKNDHAGWIFDNKVKAFTKSILPDFTSLVMGVDGDSITAGNQWSKYAADILGIPTHQNVGVGSATYACRQVEYNGVTYTTQDYDDPNFAGIATGTIPIDSPEAAQKTANNCARCHIGRFVHTVSVNVFKAPDIFCFSFGTNDQIPTEAEVTAAVSGSSLPTINESLNMAAGMRWAVQKIKQTYPDCKIFVLLPIQSYSSVGRERNLQKIEAIKKVAQAMSVPIIDMYNNCGISGILETGTGPYLSDGLHPNEAGRKMMGSLAAEQIISLYGRRI